MPYISQSGEEMKFCLLDTNIISEVVKNSSGEAKGLLTKFSPDAYAYCISIYSLVELRRSQSVYSTFLEMFSLIPFLMTKPFNGILAEEFQTYSDKAALNPIQVAVTSLNKDPRLHLKQMLEEIFSDEEVINTEKRWRDDENKVLKSWRGRIENFQPEYQAANSKDAARYVNEASLQTIISLNPEWAKEKIDRGHLIDTNHFLSMQAMLYSQYYRLYDTHWKPRPQEITDIEIIAVSPYVDTVITENFQAEILKKIKKKVAGMENLEIATLRDIRN